MKSRFFTSAKTNTLANLVGEVLLNVAPFIWFYFLNKYQGSESVAEFAVLGSLYAFGKSFIEFGMNNEAIAEVAAGNKYVVMEVILARLFLTFILFLAFLGCSVFFDTRQYLFLSLLPLLVIPFSVDWVFKAQQQSYLNVIAAGCSFVLSFIPVIFLGVGVFQLLISKLIWMVIYALVIYVFFLRCEQYGTYFKWPASLKHLLIVALDKIKACWSYALSSLVVTGSQNVPILLVAYWMNASDAGYFSFFIKLYGIFLIFKYVMMVSFLPKLARLFKEEKNSAIAELLRGTALGFLAVFCLLILLYYFKDLAFAFLGFDLSEFNYLTPFVMVLMMAAMVSWLYIYLPSLLILQHRRNNFLLAVSIGMFTSSGALALLNYVGMLNLLNSAIAIVLSEVAVLIYLIYVLRLELFQWKYRYD